ncbi:hypothetical protein [Cutibacterium sp.]|uniref:hypothetical protein n=1 Tax=Cutibacterium sp. TaxID=1912221 RepID=UPI0026DBE4CD|nr:hypothetical protein [Cutibacterium sp.]MDO4413208.1 hypothetical protein [Cutibacterium sp.]
MWSSIKPLLEAAADDESRFDGVTILGVDEHIWHHRDPRRKGPKELTGMVNLTPNQHKHLRALLLDLVPGRSGKAYRDWLSQRGHAFCAGVKIATLDSF